MQTQPTIKTKRNCRTLSTTLFLVLSLWGTAALAGSSYYTVCQNDSVFITSSGGTGGWAAFAGNPTASNVMNTGPDTAKVYGFLSSGVYGYIWNGSTGADTAYVTVNALPVADAGPDQSMCSGDFVTIGGAPTAAGGSGSYQYLWSPASGLSSATVSNPIASPVTLTTYTVTVVDQVSGCSAGDTVHVAVHANPTVSTTVTNSFCYGQPARICASGSGTTYIWATGATTTCINVLSSATYTVTTIDINGCTASASTSLSYPATAFAVTATHTDAHCSTADGSIVLTLSGGTAPYSSVIWSGGLTGTNPTNVAAGTYGYTVSDANGCQVSDTVHVSQLGSTLSVSDSVVNVSCYGSGDARIFSSVTGGTAPYTYHWSNFFTTPAVTPLQPGIYTLIVTDANGCTATSIDTVTQPASAFTSIATHTDAHCSAADGSIVLTLSGGTAPYGAVIWSGGLTGTNPTNVAAGTYGYTISDANGCQVSDTVTILQIGSTIAVADSAFNVTCNSMNNGRMVALAFGGTGPYTYSWSNGATTPQITGLSPGTYSVTAADASGCTATISDIITQPAPLILSITSVTNATCNGQNDGSACVTASGGTGGYTYTWAPAMITTPCMNGAPAGTYMVSVTDMNGCSTTAAATILQPAAISASLLASNVTCADSADGIASVSSVSGGTAPYTYLWTTFATTDSITDLGPGSYQIVIRDTNGCALLDSVQITQPAPMVVTITVTDETSPGANDGTTSATVTGGTAPYMYIWDNGAGSNSSTNLSAGSYALTVIDANACGITDTAIVGTCTTCVWPGDADANLLVDNNDLLPIGLGYDSTGPARAVTSIVWQGNQATDWAQSFGSYTPAVNYKYADCNGDGMIDATDTTAITQNFSLTHSKTIYRKPWRAGDPVIYPLLSKDTVANGDTLTVDIHLGDVSLTATNVYGLAYTINYDPAVLDTTKTTFTYGSSWLGSSADMISISKDLPAQGVIKTAVTRIDHTTRSGSGVIAQMRAIVTTDNIDGKDLSYYPVQIIISDVRAIDQHGSVLQVNEGADSTEVGYTPLGVHSMTADADVAIYPNPANSLLHITSAKTVAQSAEVVNTLGEVAGSYTWTGTQTEHTADLSSLASGIYYIRIHTRSGVAVRKFSIAH